MSEAVGQGARGLRAIIRRYPVVMFCLLLAAGSWPVQVLAGRSVALVLVGPSVCAFVVVALGEGRAGARQLWLRVLRWRVPGRYHLFALTGLGASIVGVAYAVTAIAFPGDLAAPSAAVLVSAPLNFLLIFLLVGLGEEFGWRGFLQTRLQVRSGPLRATVLVGVLWAVWHFPLVLTEQGGITPTLAWFTAGTIGASLVYAWLFNSTGGSVLLVAMMHTAVNTWAGLPYQELFSFDPPGFGFFDALAQTTAVALGALVLLLTRGRLQTHPPRAQPMTAA